jgi:hypothetical protein
MNNYLTCHGILEFFILMIALASIDALEKMVRFFSTHTVYFVFFSLDLNLVRPLSNLHAAGNIFWHGKCCQSITLYRACILGTWIINHF